MFIFNDGLHQIDSGMTPATHRHNQNRIHSFEQWSNTFQTNHEEEYVRIIYLILSNLKIKTSKAKLRFFLKMMPVTV